MVCKTPKELLLEIKKYMLSNNIMIKDLAFKMNASQSNIGKILNSDNPRLSTLYQICDALDLDISISPRDTE